MSWGWFGRGGFGFGRGFGMGRGGWTGPWPGRGPFSYLPPWQRPGWLFCRGRGWCWQFLAPYMFDQYGYPGSYRYPPSGYQPYSPLGGYGANPPYMPYQYRPYSTGMQPYGYPYAGWW